MTERILIVEDNAMNMKLFRFLLVTAGFEVIEADDGESGMELAKMYIPDLVLMDIQMPKMDGLTALQNLRADGSTRRIPVIATTSYAMKGDRERFLTEGFTDYISKPIDNDEFLKTVKTTLERYHG
ncbi:MAG: response regulator [Nitrospirae bacterium]|nr:MAG: response regulator [Nitrospirota bacterium]